MILIAILVALYSLADDTELASSSQSQWSATNDHHHHEDLNLTNYSYISSVRLSDTMHRTRLELFETTASGLGSFAPTSTANRANTAPLTTAMNYAVYCKNTADDLRKFVNSMHESNTQVESQMSRQLRLLEDKSLNLTKELYLVKAWLSKLPNNAANKSIATAGSTHPTTVTAPHTPLNKLASGGKKGKSN